MLNFGGRVYPDEGRALFYSISLLNFYCSRLNFTKFLVIFQISFMTETVKHIFLSLLSLFCISYGIFLWYGAMKNTKAFRTIPRRLNLIEFFGDLGRAIYFILGILLFLIGLFLSYKIFA